MKECPTCHRTYADETLSFCLDDGALLSASYDPNATLVLPLVDNSSVETEPNYGPEKSIATVISSVAKTGAPASFQTASDRKSIAPHFVYAIAGLFAVVIVVASLIWFSSETRSNNSSANNLSQRDNSNIVRETPGQLLTRETPASTKVQSASNQTIQSNPVNQVKEVEKTTEIPPASSNGVQEKTKNECYTPCTITIRRNQSLWTDEQSVQIRKKGETKWTILAGAGNVNLPTGEIDVVGYPDTKKRILIEVADSY